MDREVMTAARDSFDRVCKSPGFFAAFYDNFFRICPEAEALFAQTDFERQHKLLRHAIGLLLSFPDQPLKEPTILSRLAERHGHRDLKIKSELYPPFVDALLTTIHQHDRQFTPAIERAWRSALAPGVAYMQSKY
jgi:hemoglobin-like flavoprotein